MGYPVVTVRAERRHAATGEVELDVEQRWFLADGSAVAPEEEKLWTVPIIASCQGGAPFRPGSGQCILFDQRSATINVGQCAEGGWLKLNAGQHSLFRVQVTAL
jgi:hypothetical protein